MIVLWGSRRWVVTWLAWVVAGSSGCTSDSPQKRDHDQWPGIDAAPDPTECAVEDGTTFVFSGLEVPSEGEGRDFNGDGTPDNILGRLAPAINPGWEESVARGSAMYLLHVTGLPGPGPETPAYGPTPVELAWYFGTDVDEDAANNTKGDGHFVVSAAQLDVNCDGIAKFDQATLEGDVLTASDDDWDIIFSTGTIPFVDVLAQIEFEDGFTEGKLEAGLIATACGLSQSYFPGHTTGTILDQVVPAFDIQPDIDIDGDGLETIVANTKTGIISGCVDGDGTKVPGNDCPCHPRIADGYSWAIRGKLVRAHIDGVVNVPR